MIYSTFFKPPLTMNCTVAALSQPTSIRHEYKTRRQDNESPMTHPQEMTHQNPMDEKFTDET